MAAPAH
jgi:hypothetical protein